MEIELRDPIKITQKPARPLNPERQRIAEDIVDDMLSQGIVEEYNGPWSSPICLVTVPGKKPRLTGDYSGPDGLNNNTISVEANLPRISDVSRYLTQAKYIACLVTKSLLANEFG
ncbi:hypothetical protein GEMRC1_002254 [Eukaryota sp. GEM-RC1]